jgi:hypothetical protein
VEHTEETEDGTSGNGYSTGKIGYKPGNDLYTTKGRRKKLIEENFNFMSIAITSLYTQIDDIAKEGNHKMVVIHKV